MFFDKETISFNILDVLRLDQTELSTDNSGRNFNALSFRFSADTVLKTSKGAYRIKENFVTYVPARLNYTRTTKRDELIVVHFETTDYNTRSIEFFEAKEPEVLAELFLKILKCWEGRETGYKLKCSAILCEIFAECYLQNYKQERKNSKIQPSVDYIHGNYKDSALTVKEIADRSFMSEVYFRRLFKNEFGISPQKYIINLRIQNAAGLISTGYYSLKEIAYMSGYSDYKYFSVEFKKAMGVSPSEYLYNFQ